MKKGNRIYIYDSTLRDGAQTSTINFSVRDKIQVAKMLDEIGVDYIEGGWPGANPTDDNFFAKLPNLKKSKFSAFGMTRRSSVSCGNDPVFNKLATIKTDFVCIVGKAWDFHLRHALNITEEENLKMIEDSIKYLIASGKEVMFDAEHFFDGFKINKEFSLKVARKAFESGARWVVLCDTNGGSLPHEVLDIVKSVSEFIPGENLGIHCHNDTGNAVANSIAAVIAGARQIQGTINGIGERCGNANLTSLIPTLMIKMGYDIGIDQKHLKNLTNLSKLVDEIVGRDNDNFAPYVGKFAFAHKGGLHVSAVVKNPTSYEHIDPDLVGNKRIILVSDQSGKSNIISRLKDIGLDVEKNIKHSQISELIDKVKDLESKGYAYDLADASFEILVKKTLGVMPQFFTLKSFRVLDELRYINNKKHILSEASIKVEVGGELIMTVAEGNGPVNAIDAALRLALSKHYKILENIVLSDYKVKILTPSDGTKAVTRVQIVSKDEKGNKWITIGVSKNIVEASFDAINDSISYVLSRSLVK